MEDCGIATEVGNCESVLQGSDFSRRRGEGRFSSGQSREQGLDESVLFGKDDLVVFHHGFKIFP